MSVKVVVLGAVGAGGERRSIVGDVDCDLCGVEGEDASGLSNDEVSDDLTGVGDDGDTCCCCCCDVDTVDG